MLTKDIGKESLQFAHLLHVRPLKKKKGICKTMTEKWRKDVKSVEKFFVLDRNREDLFFGDNI